MRPNEVKKVHSADAKTSIGFVITGNAGGGGCLLGSSASFYCSGTTLLAFEGRAISDLCARPIIYQSVIIMNMKKVQQELGQALTADASISEISTPRWSTYKAPEPIAVVHPAAEEDIVETVLHILLVSLKMY